MFNYSGLFGTIRAGIQKHIEANFVTNFDTLLLPFAEHKLLSPLILYVWYSNVMITLIIILILKLEMIFITFFSDIVLNSHFYWLLWQIETT